MRRESNPLSATGQALTRLYRLLQYSLPCYLMDADPWAGPQGRSVLEIVRRIAEDRRRFAERVGSLLVDREWPIPSGSYPLRYTAFNDLAIDSLLPHLIAEQRSVIEEVEGCVELLQDDPPAKALVQEILGSERAHLDALLECAAPRKAATADRQQEQPTSCLAV